MARTGIWTRVRTGRGRSSESGPPGGVRGRRARHDRANGWFRLCVAVIWPSAQLLTRRRRSGLDNVPTHGGVLLVANHVSAVDPLTVAQLVYDAGRLPHFLAKASPFTAPVVGPIMRGAEQIPVRRNSAEAAGSLSAAFESLQAGRVVIIYPEGTTTRDPDMWPMRARTGVARLALTGGVPVLPLTQWGAQAILQRGGRLHPFARPVVHAVIGAPVDLSAWQGAELSPTVLREVTDVIMAAITAPLAAIRGEPLPTQVWDPRPGAARAADLTSAGPGSAADTGSAGPGTPDTPAGTDLAAPEAERDSA